MNATCQREECRTLLQRMLACLRRSRETPLQFEIDAAGIVAAALADAPASLAGDESGATTGLNGLIEDLLGAEHRASSGRETASKPASLAAWLTRLYRSLRAVHPAAIDIVALRLDGYDDRAIAERLRLGPRLVRHITSQMRADWETETA